MKVRSWSNWLLHIDRNTNYFHHHMSQNFIASLKTTDGRRLTDDEDVDNHIVEFYIRPSLHQNRCGWTLMLL